MRRLNNIHEDRDKVQERLTFFHFWQNFFYQQAQNTLDPAMAMLFGILQHESIDVGSVFGYRPEPYDILFSGECPEGLGYIGNRFVYQNMRDGRRGSANFFVGIPFLDHPRAFHMPLYYTRWAHLVASGQESDYGNAPREFGISVVISKTIDKGLARKRALLAHALSHYVPVHATRAIAPVAPADSKVIYHEVPDKFAFVSRFTHNLCFENQAAKGYLTEKIFDSLIAGAVPLYHGDPDVGEWFEEGSFMECGGLSAEQIATLIFQNQAMQDVVQERRMGVCKVPLEVMRERAASFQQYFLQHDCRVRNDALLPRHELPESSAKTPPPYSIKRGTLQYLLKKHHIHNFIETGTYRGETTASIAPYVQKVYTVELSVALHAAAVEQFAQTPHVICLHGDSGDLLAGILEELEEPALLWLDGHYSGGITAKGSEHSPILRELQHISTSTHANAHVILIDDARCFGANGYPTVDFVKQWFQQHMPNHVVRVYRDMIFAEPPKILCDLSDEAKEMAYHYEPRRGVSNKGAYTLIPCLNFDDKAAWDAGFDELDCVSALYVTSASRFGSVQQVAQALAIALNHGLQSVYLPDIWWLASGTHILTNGLRVVNKGSTYFDDEEVLLSGDFSDLKDLLAFSAGEVSFVNAMGLLSGFIVAKPSGPNWHNPPEQHDMMLHFPKTSTILP